MLHYDVIMCTSGVYDVIISWYQVDVACGHVDAYPRVAIPREVSRLSQVSHVVGGLEMTTAGLISQSLQVLSLIHI